MGYTLDPYTYLLNEITLTNDKDAGAAGSNDLSGTLRLEGGDVRVYNLHVKNAFGLPHGYNQANQAIAASASTSRVGMHDIFLSSYS
jgi:pectinesterase